MGGGLAKIENSRWRSFKIDELFEIQLAKGDIQAKKMELGEIPLVSAGMSNNGIVMYIKKGDGISEIFSGNVLTVDMFGTAFYQQKPFFAVSHGRVNILVPKFSFNRQIGLFCTAVLNKILLGKYSFTHMCNQSNLHEEQIYLPTKDGENPDLEFMTEYVSKLYSDVHSCMV